MNYSHAHDVLQTQAEVYCKDYGVNCTWYGLLEDCDSEERCPQCGAFAEKFADDVVQLTEEEIEQVMAGIMALTYQVGLDDKFHSVFTLAFRHYAVRVLAVGIVDPCTEDNLVIGGYEDHATDPADFDWQKAHRILQHLEALL